MKNVYLFWPNIIGYVRVIFAAASFYLMKNDPLPSMIFYALSSLLDAFDGWVARLLNQGTRFGAVLDMVTDRSATTCLLVHLSQIYPHYTLLVQFLIALDLSSHYMQMVSSLTLGAESHKQVAKEANLILRLYYTSRVVLFLVCAGNEIFLMTVYILFHFSNTLLWTLAFVMFPVFILKQLLNIVQLLQASKLLVEMDIKSRIDKCE